MKTIDDRIGKQNLLFSFQKPQMANTMEKIENFLKTPMHCVPSAKGANKTNQSWGLMVVNAMEESKKFYLTGGTILDPNNGKIYKCNISYNAKTGTLDVRGSLDKRGWVGRSWNMGKRISTVY